MGNEKLCKCGCDEIIIRPKDMSEQSWSRTKYKDKKHRDNYYLVTKTGETKPCACGCGMLLERRINDTPYKWNKRKFFNSECRLDHYKETGSFEAPATEPIPEKKLKEDPPEYVKEGMMKRMMRGAL